MPPGVLALLAERDEPVRAGNVVSLQRRPAAVQRLQLPLALAASIALVVGFLAAHLIGPLTTGPAEGPPAWLADGTIAASSPLFDVLENQPSGSVTELAGGAATPILSFARSGGGFCRELQVRSAAGSSRTVACREKDGWLLRVAEFTPAGTDGYQMASQSGSAVASTVARLRDGAPLDAASEAALLGSWKR
jgi:hypothetical protein